MILSVLQTSQYKVKSLMSMSLYIHFPWCVRKCPYCDFNSHKSPDELPEQDYVEALVKDLQQDIELIGQKPHINSIFLGGGTPSLFHPKSLGTLLEKLSKMVYFNNEIEITLEANPGTTEHQKFSEYKAIGINRLSLGIQSFNDCHLKALGRIHNADEAKKAIANAQNAGIWNINLDIMHGLPKQTKNEALIDIKTAISFNPKHISWYQLTLEPNTAFYKNPPTLPDTDNCFEFEHAGFEILEKNGYRRYEISAFCLDNNYAKHNMNYWLYGDYLGIGAGAHGKLNINNEVIRTQKRKLPKHYLNKEKPFLAEKKIVEKSDIIFEFMLNTTRLNQAISKKLFEKSTSLNFADIYPRLKQAERMGFITLTDNEWSLTTLGRNFTNDLQALFLPA